MARTIRLEVREVPERLTADDFFTGIIAGLALRGRTSISIRGDSFDRAFATLYEDLQARAHEEKLDIRFRIRPHPVHGDSMLVRDAIAHAVQRGLIGLDNPEFQDIRLKLPGEEAELLIEQVPGSRALYVDLAERFLQVTT